MAARVYQVARRFRSRQGGTVIDVPDIAIPAVEDAMEDEVLKLATRKSRRHAQRIANGNGYAGNKFAPLARWLKRGIKREGDEVSGMSADDAVERFERYHKIYELTDRMIDKALARRMPKEFAAAGWRE